ncbi:MAG: hypothetical protein QOG13_323 [Sphingomonadales bacterium]|jgi:Ca2+-binding RTX toxin-like protein|nr:hypothetical protein [Sphingomonadales bacterium]
MPTITGTPGGDTLVGTAQTDLIQGLGGNDILTDTLGGDDTLDGGDDDDLIVVTRPTQGTNETLLGGNGNDILRFTGARDAGDFISGGAGADLIEVSGFDFVVDAGSGDDRVYVSKLGGGNSPTVTLGPGQDAIGLLSNTFSGQSLVVTDFTPGDGGDRIDWGVTLASLDGWDQSGNPFASGYLSLLQSGDIVAVQVNVNPSQGGPSNIYFLSGFAPSALTAFNLGGYASNGAAPANLTLTGTAAADTLNGANGNDTITGDAGNDVLYGGAGHDEIHGGADNDTIDGWFGNDTLFGDGGDDIIVDDWGFRGTIDGGTGNDTIRADISKHPNLSVPQPIAPTMFARTIAGGDGDDHITVIGYTHGDIRRVTEATITGGADNDVIDVTRTYAVIDAGTGNDLVIIRNAIDANPATVTLGNGVDTLRLTDISSGTNIAAVTVTDFVTGPGGDVVDVPAVIASRNFGWDYQGNPFAGGFVRLMASGGDTLLQGKINNATWVTLAIFQSTTPAAFTAENLGGWDSSGAPPPPQVINGTPGDDTLAGGVGNDTINGLAGDDTLTGGFGNDTLNGADDDDYLDGQWGNDTLNGGNGNDVLTDTNGGNDIFNGGDGDDILTDSASGNDTFNGGNGNDTITAHRTSNATFTVDAGDGNDIITLDHAFGTVLAGAGNDILVIDSSGMTVDGGSGDDDITVDGSVVLAGTGNDIIRSQGGSQALTLGGGKDIVLIQGSGTNMTIQDFQVGEEGDRLDLSTRFGVNPFGPGGELTIEQVGADTRIHSLNNTHVFLLKNVTATDLSTYNLGVPTGSYNPGPRSFTGTPGPDEYVSADGNDNLSGLGGNDTLYGAGGNDSIDGGAGQDQLYGGSGNDFIDGGADADTMYGGTGNDIFIVDHPADQIVEYPGEGRDVVYARSSYTLGAGVSVEILSALDQAATTAMELVGNALDQEIYGNAGANFLQGGGGTDYLFGYAGDDVYLVAGAGDHVFESGGGGRDVVYALANYTLEAGQEIEVLSAASQAATTPLELIGNALNQEIYGNAGANFLQGGGGTDYLFGLGGNDTYLVSGANERVFEGAGGGARDVVYAQASFTLEAGQEIEVLSAANQAGTGALTLIGNSGGQEIYGNAGANFIQGGGGADYLFGFGGNDTYLVSGSSEHVFENAGGGRDVVYAQANYALDAGQEIEVLSTASQGATTAIDLTGNNLANELYGNNGANILNGGAGADYLLGYGGADTFQFTTALGGGNVDALADFNAVDDTIALDDAVFAGLTPGALPASAFVAGSAAGDADDRIIYNSATGQILFDADGNGSGLAVLFATVQPGTVLTASDFTVI